MEETELINRIKQGDKSALNTLIEDNYQAVFSYFYRNTGNYHQAKDLTQEVFTKVINKRLGSFSGGMLRRIGIAQTLLNDPEILILDEPTAGLDPYERVRFRNILSELSGNRIVLLSTHIVTDLEFIAGQIILLRGGQVLKMEHTDNLISSVNGKVWSAVLSQEEFNQVKHQHRIGNIMKKSDGMEVRIISDKKPLAQAVLIQPILEDVYTYYFGGLHK